MLRAELAAEIASAGAAPVIRVTARGTSPVERLVSLVLLGDLVTIYAAVLRGADPVDIPALDGLKAAMSTDGLAHRPSRRAGAPRRAPARVPPRPARRARPARRPRPRARLAVRRLGASCRAAPRVFAAPPRLRLACAAPPVLPRARRVLPRRPARLAALARRVLPRRPLVRGSLRPRRGVLRTGRRVLASYRGVAMSSIASEPASGAAGVLQVASIVDGRARTDAPGGTLTSTNPALTADVVATVSLGDASVFVDAARAARAAQKEWAAVPAPARGRVIAQVGRLVEANKESLARLVTREIGKPYPEALGEVQEIVDTCDFFLGEGRRLYGQTVPSEMPNKQLFTFRMPVGVAAIITAGNFPVAVPAWYLVPGDPVRQRRRVEAGGVLAPRWVTRWRSCSTRAACLAAC